MSADLYFTTDSFFLLSFFFFRRLISLNGTQPKSATCSELTVLWKRISKIWGIPSPYKSGAQNHFFQTTSQLNGNFNRLYLQNETRCRQSVKCIDNHKAFPGSSKHFMNFGPQTASNWTVIFYPPYVNYAFYVIARIRRRRSGNKTQPNFAKRRMVNRANNPL